MVPRGDAGTLRAFRALSLMHGLVLWRDFKKPIYIYIYMIGGAGARDAGLSLRGLAACESPCEVPHASRHLMD